MESTVIVAILSAAGSLVGSLVGLLCSIRMTDYRLKQLEKKVDKHNNFAARLPVLEEKMKVADHRISDLESETKEAKK